MRSPAQADRDLRDELGLPCHSYRPAHRRQFEILCSVNDHFGNIRIMKRITQEVPAKVAADEKYQLAMANNDQANAKIEMIRALGTVMNGLLADETQLFQQFSDNPSFKKWLEDSVFRQTYNGAA